MGEETDQVGFSGCCPRPELELGLVDGGSRFWEPEAPLTVMEVDGSLQLGRVKGLGWVDPWCGRWALGEAEEVRLVDGP